MTNTQDPQRPALMTAQLRRGISSLLALAIVGGCGWLIYAGARAVWGELIAVDPQVAVAVVAAATTLVVSTATVMLGRYYERKKEIEAHFRAEKIKIYDEFLGELFNVFHSSGTATDDSMVAFLRAWQRKLVLWGGSGVLKAYFAWMNRLKSVPDAETVFLMDVFFRALRTDIGQDSRGLERGAFAQLLLRHGQFFLQEAAKNPNITLAELSKKEKAQFGSDT